MAKKIQAPKPRDRALSIILAVLVLVTGFFVLKSSFGSIQDLQNQKKALAQEAETLSQRLEALGTMQTNFEGLREQGGIEKFVLMLPKGRDISNLLATLEVLAREKGLILSSVAVEEPRPAGEGVESTDLKIELSGKIDYPMLKTLLAAVENNLRLLETTNVAFVPGESQILLQLKTFSLSSVLPPAAAVPTAFPSEILTDQKFLDLKLFGKLPLTPGRIGNTSPFPAPPPPPVPQPPET